MAAAAPPKVFIATPAYGCLVANAYLSSLLAARVELSRRGIASAVHMTGNESLVQRARNLMTAAFLRSDCTHMVWIDADIAFNAETLLRMLEFDKDITTAIYAKKNINWDRVYAATTSAEPLEQRGLDFNINVVGASPLEGGSDVTDYIALYDCMIDPESRRYLSEDYAFVRRAQLLGIKVHACIRSCLGHVGSFTYKPSMGRVGAPAT
ncbi:hypothetical protein OEZ85_010998 [Tetradesmus obliquus]|uniref:Uncharacterized protein n=1 Tax=Tetradesmus obliquus TaxID=3088 RepID=A0ABY8TR41_TETOB|nr:hypothetical protein OEZ85_010998 [Tetradesmus obliquus]